MQLGLGEKIDVAQLLSQGADANIDKDKGQGAHKGNDDKKPEGQDGPDRPPDYLLNTMPDEPPYGTPADEVCFSKIVLLLS